MKEVDFKAELKTLRQIFQEMKTLLAWQQLKHSEARQISISGIRLYETTNTDLLDKYSSFLSIAKVMNEHQISQNGHGKQWTKEAASKVLRNDPVQTDLKGEPLPPIENFISVLGVKRDEQK